MMQATHSVGEQLREWREATGLQQDQVATAARERGLRWTRATVAAIEIGRRELSLAEFFALRGSPLGHDEFAGFFAQASTERAVAAKVAERMDAEIKAARKLGLEPRAVVAAARKLWGHTLTEERERIMKEWVVIDRDSVEYWRRRGQVVGQPASPRAIQAQRGHTTRVLLSQLQQALKKGKRR